MTNRPDELPPSEPTSPGVLSGVEDLPLAAAHVRALAGRVVADPHRADDLAQELWVEECRGLTGEARQSTVVRRGFGFVAGVLRNLARRETRGELRRRRREHSVASGGAARTAPPADEAVQHAEVLREVVAAALALDEPYRSTVLMRFLQDRSVADVASAMGVPASTVRVRCKRALQTLRERLAGTLGAGYLATLQSFSAGPGLTPAAAGRDSSSTSSSIEPERAFIPRGKSMWNSPSWNVACLGAIAVVASIGTASLQEAEDGPGPFAALDNLVPDPVAAEREGREAVLSRHARARMRPATPSSIRTPFALPPQGVEGRVVDTGGRPVQGATVQVWNRVFGGGTDRYRHGARAQAPVEVTTDTEGRFVVPSRSGNRRWGLSVSAPGFALARTAFGPEKREDIVLAPATTMTGVVRDAATGHPIPGVRLSVHGLQFDGVRLDLVRTSTTDQEGRYSLDGLPATRRLTVECSVDGALAAYPVFDLDPIVSNTRDLVIDRSQEVELVVTDGANLEPVVGAEVFASGFERRLLGVSGFQGRLRVPRTRIESGTSEGRELDDAVAIASAQAPGFARTARRLARGVGELELRLVRSGRLRGIVRDEDGELVEGAWVSWLAPPLEFVEPRSSGANSLDSIEATTGGDGEFVFPNVLTGRRVVEGKLRVRHGDRVVDLHGVLPNAAGEERVLEIVLATPRAVRGVVSIHGTAAVHGWVELEGVESARRESTHTAADGSFEFTGLLPGTYRVRARAVGADVVTEVRVDDSDVDDVDLDVAVATGHIHGSVCMDDGAPATGARVAAFLTHESGAPPSVGDGGVIETPDDFVILGPESAGSGFALVAGLATVDENGAFDIVLPAHETARYRVAIYQGGFGIVLDEVPQGAESIAFRVPRLASVRLALSEVDSGQQVESVGVRWSHAASGRSVTLAWNRPRPTAAGVLALELPIGSVELTLLDPSRGIEHVVQLEVPESGLSGGVPVRF